MDNTVKLKVKIYQDAKGRLWRVQKESLPRKRGYYTYWIAECEEISVSFREDKLKLILENIKRRL